MKYTVGEYSFDDELTAEKARKEAETISFIRSRTDFTKPENAQRIINTIRSNNMFETRLGLDFVDKLERFVNGGENASLDLTSGISEPVVNQEGEEGNYAGFTPEEEEKLREEVRRRTKHIKEAADDRIQRTKNEYKAKSRNLYLIIGAMAFIIAILLVLTLTSDVSPFYDAEKAVIDKYSAWQEELDLKEQHLIQWEDELRELEKSLKDN